MNHLLILFIAIPLLGFFVNLLLPKHKEDLISTAAFVTVAVQGVFGNLFLLYWLFNGRPAININELEIYRSREYVFYIDFLWDHITAVYFFAGSMLTSLVTAYSRCYMHREHGYKRFFNSILFFYCGYTLIILSGNLETMFVGWEILGISSFLLIAFYRQRYLPVKNAVKVFSIYRIGDIGILLAMWICHHLFHANITFLNMSELAEKHELFQSTTSIGVIMSCMILLAAAAKSALFPFSSWLPRAMEGPTPSSAIFYGSLSVHIGVFIMFRTRPFWENQLITRLLIGLAGLLTAVLAAGMSRVQPTIKSQVAYASITQIGIIFIELALGLEYIALLHFAANACMRTYQLLVSPSSVAYLIREQYYSTPDPVQAPRSGLYKKMEYTLYLLALKEFNLDTMMYKYLWNPMKWIGKKFGFPALRSSLLILIPLYATGVYAVHHKNLLPENIQHILPYIFILTGFLLALQGFVERIHARMSWVMLVMNHFWIALTIAFNENFDFNEIYLYLSGVVISGIPGLAALNFLKRKEGTVDLDKFHGYSYKYPGLTLIFLLSCLGMTGFPVTPTFIGEDLIFAHIHAGQFWLAIICSLSFIIEGIAVIRIYSRVFLGPYSKNIHEMAYRGA